MHTNYIMLSRLFFASILQLVIGYCNTYDFDIKGNPLHAYYIQSFIGTPPQRINLIVDTGSSNLAVAVVHRKNVDEHFFAYNESLTFRPTDVNIRLRYVQGYWSGFIGLDVFNPCLEQDCTVVCNISCMSSAVDIFDDNSKYQGIIGLAYSSIAYPNSQVRPFLDVFFTEKNITNIFSLFLCGPFFSSKEESSSCGKLHVGYFSEKYFLGDIFYTPIIHEWFYEITVLDIKVDKNSVPFQCEELNRNNSFIDSGTTNLNLPLIIYPWIISEIKNHVKSHIPNNFWKNETVVCMKNKALNASLFPTLILSVYHSSNKSFDLHVSPELYLLPVSNNTCAKLAIGISNYGVMIGSSVLRGFYVIFDRENKRIGFAEPAIFQNTKFISKIPGYKTHFNNLDHCIRKEVLFDSGFPAGLGLILICLIFITFCVLLPLLMWVWKYHIKKISMDKSDIINLVDDD